jgi:hypothetical protein
MTKIKVLKPFTFSSAPTDAASLGGTERRFTVGDHEIPDEIANHPWIKAGADGHIEGSPKSADRGRAAG